MSPRFYLPGPIDSDRAVLTGDEAHHASRVMRAAPGDMLVLFDGEGGEFDGRVAAVARSRIELEITGRREADRETGRRLTLAVALPKGDRARWLVEKATELGVASIVPLVTSRGVAQPTEGAVRRLRRAVIEACKQCGRNRLMTIASPRGLQGWSPAPQSTPAHWLADPSSPDPLSAVLEGSATDPPDVVAAIGPEGGFTEEEVGGALAAGWRTFALGPRTLRVETAALAVAAICSVARQPA